VKGVKTFYVTKYEPRMPHPRQLITTISVITLYYPTFFLGENLVGQEGNQISLRFYHQQFTPALVVTVMAHVLMVVVVMVLEVVDLVVVGGMDHTTAHFLREMGNVMCAVT
jgi:hypothetical protein